ncbi:hypothetical protein DK52_3285 [Brucella abortus]|nr:hypothetical protein DK52_3285 [Brucella abortus]
MFGDKCARPRYIRWIKRFCINGNEIFRSTEWINLRSKSFKYTYKNISPNSGMKINSDFHSSQCVPAKSADGTAHIFFCNISQGRRQIDGPLPVNNLTQ